MTTKILLGILASAGVAATSAVSYEFLIKPQNIEQKLEQNNYRILGDEQEDTTRWTEIVNKWDQDDKKLSNFVNTSEDVSDNQKKIEALKKKCLSVIKEKISEENYENAKNYCSILKEGAR